MAEEKKDRESELAIKKLSMNPDFNTHKEMRSINFPFLNENGSRAFTGVKYFLAR